MRETWLKVGSKLGATFGKALSRRIVWLRNNRADLFGDSATRHALVAVIGRQWYRERRKAYPIRGIAELRKVLRLELAGQATTLFHIGPLKDDKRQVTTYELSKDFDLDMLRAALLVPESRIVGLGLNDGDIAVVANESQPYFVTADGTSQQQGGALQNAELFAMAIGAPPPEQVLELDEAAVRERLLPALRKVPLADWLDSFNPAALKNALRLAQPLSIGLASLALIYLLIVSAYLSGMTALRNYQIEQLGPEVNGLLEKQRRLEALAGDYRGLADLTDQTLATYKIWGVITNVWQSGGSVSAVSIADGTGSLRGVAPVATDVLSQLGSEPAVRNPSFDAPVRQSGGGEEFVIKFTLARQGATP